MISIVKKLEPIVTTESTNPIFEIPYELSAVPDKAWSHEIEKWSPSITNNSCNGLSSKPFFLSCCPKVRINGKVLILCDVQLELKDKLEANLKAVIETVNKWYVEVYEPGKKEQDRIEEEKKKAVSEKVEEVKRKLME